MFLGRDSVRTDRYACRRWFQNANSGHGPLNLNKCLVRSMSSNPALKLDAEVKGSSNTANLTATSPRLPLRGTDFALDYRWAHKC